MSTESRYFWCEDSFICDHERPSSEGADLFEEVEPVEELNSLNAALAEQIAARETAERKNVELNVPRTGDPDSAILDICRVFTDDNQKARP